MNIVGDGYKLANFPTSVPAFWFFQAHTPHLSMPKIGTPQTPKLPMIQSEMPQNNLEGKVLFLYRSVADADIFSF